MKAGVGRRSSYIWRSIISAKSVIEHWTMWRIGDGEDMQVWGDKWIPMPSTFSVQTPINTLPADAKVKDLIDTYTKEWKVTIVKEIFWEEEAQSILKIPLSPLRSRDRRIWRGTKNGEYSVRSAYHMEMEMELSMVSSSSGSGLNQENTLWQKVLKHKVPNVVKMFLLRAFNKLMPTKTNLYRRGW